MSDRFIQLHLLTFYGPANLNRDDTGRPKTAIVGGVERLRVSSQAIKRAVRTSEAFESELKGRLGKRSRNFGRQVVLKHLLEKNIPEKKAEEAVAEIMKLFTKGKGNGEAKEATKGDKDSLQSGQMIFLSDGDVAKVNELALAAARGGKTPLQDDLRKALSSSKTSADIAMFGRMMSGIESLGVEAAVQVAHAFTTHAADIESDVFVAVDEHPLESEGRGAGHFDSTGVGFGSGVFYTYVCIDRALLIDNLGGNEALARDAIAALTRGLATVSPTGKQASFASRARASFILAERGDEQPRQLSGAFLKPVKGADLMDLSIKALTDYRRRMKQAYGDAADNAANTAIMDITKPDGGSLTDIIAFVAR
ncbi:MAG: type I-E CRISPR-associated protein Cas7/Cse4/CasC [Agrobacterium albertimagni]